MDIYGQALQDFYDHQPKEKLWLNNNYGGPEEMPTAVFFGEKLTCPKQNC